MQKVPRMPKQKRNSRRLPSGVLDSGPTPSLAWNHQAAYVRISSHWRIQKLRPNYLHTTIQKHQDAIMEDWRNQQMKVVGRRMSASEENQLTSACRDFLTALREATQSGVSDISKPEWSSMRDLLTALSSSRAKAG